jgi:hypothetical protein
MADTARQSSGSVASVLSSATNHDDDGPLRPGERAGERYAKRTMKRALAATRKRHAYQLASVMMEANGEGTEFFRMEPRKAFRMIRKNRT